MKHQKPQKEKGRKKPQQNNKTNKKIPKQNKSNHQKNHPNTTIWSNLSYCRDDWCYYRLSRKVLESPCFNILKTGHNLL